jgi:hypothetical protein
MAAAGPTSFVISEFCRVSLRLINGLLNKSAVRQSAISRENFRAFSVGQNSTRTGLEPFHDESRILNLLGYVVGDWSCFSDTRCASSWRFHSLSSWKKSTTFVVISRASSRVSLRSEYDCQTRMV